MTHKWYLSAPSATFYVETNECGIVTKTAPIAWRFKGQHVDRLKKYFRVTKEVEL